MKYIISGRNIDLTEALESEMTGHMDKLKKYFLPETEAQVTLSVEKFGSTIEITIPFNGRILRAEVEGDDMYALMLEAVNIIERQLLKYKSKFRDKSRSKSKAVLTKEFMESSKTAEEPELKIEKIKRFNIKPMHVEEAVLQMELLGHNFFVFLDENITDVNVVYKRKNGTYGLIEPTLD